MDAMLAQLGYRLEPLPRRMLWVRTCRTLRGPRCWRVRSAPHAKGPTQGCQQFYWTQKHSGYFLVVPRCESKNQHWPQITVGSLRGVGKNALVGDGKLKK
jgi:hypothetical protein